MGEVTDKKEAQIKYIYRKISVKRKNMLENSTLGLQKGNTD